MEYDLLNIPFHKELNTHKLRRTVQAPNSYFQTLKCIACENTQISFSHGQSKVNCLKCNKLLALPSGGKLKMTEDAKFQVLPALSRKIQKKREEQVAAKTEKVEEKAKPKNSKKN